MTKCTTCSFNDGYFSLTQSQRELTGDSPWLQDIVPLDLEAILWMSFIMRGFPVFSEKCCRTSFLFGSTFNMASAVLMSSLSSLTVSAFDNTQSVSCWYFSMAVSSSIQELKTCPTLKEISVSWCSSWFVNYIIIQWSQCVYLNNNWLNDEPLQSGGIYTHKVTVNCLTTWAKLSYVDKLCGRWLHLT